MPHFVTSHQEEDHITDYNAARFNAGIIGADEYLLEGQGNMAASMVDSNTLRLLSGDAVTNGRHWAIDESYEEYTVENGTPGYKRIDLVVAHIETMPSDTIDIRVLKGDETTGTPVMPSHIHGDLNAGATVTETPICSVLINGINPDAPAMILKTIPSLKKLWDSISQMQIDIVDALDDIRILKAATPRYNLSSSVIQLLFGESAAQLWLDPSMGQINFPNGTTHRLY